MQVIHHNISVNGVQLALNMSELIKSLDKLVKLSPLCKSIFTEFFKTIPTVILYIMSGIDQKQIEFSKSVAVYILIDKTHR